MKKKDNSTKDTTAAVDTAEVMDTEVASEQADAQKSSQPESYTLTREEFNQAREHIQKLEKEKTDMVELLQRNQADFDNYRRRNAQIRSDSFDEGKRDAISALLPILDDFDRMLANTDNADKAFVEGVRLIHSKLCEALAKQGLEEISSKGSFDPAIHNAVMVEQAEGTQSGQVLEVFMKGYKIKDRVIRAAMVKVSQ